MFLSPIRSNDLLRRTSLNMILLAAYLRCSLCYRNAFKHLSAMLRVDTYFHLIRLSDSVVGGSSSADEQNGGNSWLRHTAQKIHKISRRRRRSYYFLSPRKDVLISLCSNDRFAERFGRSGPPQSSWVCGESGGTCRLNADKSAVNATMLPNASGTLLEQVVYVVFPKTAKTHSLQKFTHSSCVFLFFFVTLQPFLLTPFIIHLFIWKNNTL